MTDPGSDATETEIDRNIAELSAWFKAHPVRDSTMWSSMTPQQQRSWLDRRRSLERWFGVKVQMIVTGSAAK